MLGGAKVDSKWVMRKVFYLLRLRLELLGCRETAFGNQLDVAGSAMRVFFLLPLFRAKSSKHYVLVVYTIGLVPRCAASPGRAFILPPYLIVAG